MTEEGDWAKDPVGKHRVRWRAEKNEREWRAKEASTRNHGVKATEMSTAKLGQGVGLPAQRGWDLAAKSTDAEGVATRWKS